MELSKFKFAFDFALVCDVHTGKIMFEPITYVSLPVYPARFAGFFIIRNLSSTPLLGVALAVRLIHPDTGTLLLSVETQRYFQSNPGIMPQETATFCAFLVPQPGLYQAQLVEAGQLRKADAKIFSELPLTASLFVNRVP